MMCNSKMKSDKFIVLLEPGVWIADIEGDPGRTCVRENAKITTLRNATILLATARQYHAFQTARIEKYITDGDLP